MHSGRLEALHGDSASAFDHLALAIRNYQDSGSSTSIRSPLVILATFLDRLGRYEPAATIAGFAVSPMTAALEPGAEHRDRPPPRHPRRGDLRIARPQGRDHDHRRNGDLRIRSNRPGPSRTERGLEIDDICDTRRPASRPSDFPGRGVSEVRLRNTCLIFSVSAFMSHLGDTRSTTTGSSARVGYTRVSTVSQTLDQQNAALEAVGVSKTFSDTMSGARDDRPGLAELMAYVREGDSVVVWKLDRLRTQYIAHFGDRQGPHRPSCDPGGVGLCVIRDK
jgi:Resolvase, N terminal domain